MKQLLTFFSLGASLKLALGVCILPIVSGCTSQEETAEARFQGCWSLDKVESRSGEAGEWKYDSAFQGWTGYILYDGHGHMGVQITPRGYQDAEVSNNPDTLTVNELINLVKFYQSNWVYMADYSIHGATIEHKRRSATNPADWGSVLVRDFEFRHDTLLLTAHEGAGEKRSRLFWVKK